MPIHDPPTFPPKVEAARAALLRQGVALLGEARSADDRPVLCVSSVLEEWAFNAMAELLPGVEFEWSSETPRVLRPRWVRRCWEREPGRLQLRVVLYPTEHVDEILVAEDEHIVSVLVTVCMSVVGPPGEPCEMPHHVYLDRPLGLRKVIDGVTRDELELIDLDAVWAGDA